MYARENRDSDQSISEEEGPEDSWKERAVSLSDAPNNYEGGMRVVSQLEMLKDYHEMHPTSDKHISSHERKMGLCADDEVENPCFDEDDDCMQSPRINSSNHYNEGPIFLSTVASILQSDEETISDNEKINLPTLKSAKEDESSTWSEASMEVKALICLHENSGTSSHGVAQKAYKSCKGGGKAKSKRKFSFHFQPCKEDLSLLGGDGNRWPPLEKIALPNEVSAAVHKDMDKVMVENRLVVGEKVELPENHIAPFELSGQHDFKENSMAQSLIKFHERSVLMLGSSEMGIERKGIGGEHIVLDKHTSPVGEEFLDVDDLPEALDSGPSSDDEAFLETHQNTNSIILRTMADQFHEAFGTVSVNDARLPLALPGPLYDGLFKRLQRVVQIEERELAPLKISNAGTNSLDERSCISVRILSRSLEAKLTVCTCTSIGHGEKTC
ncbi:uncharacterized protein [Henckelia pumila]|uniref:uncharacterized protein isoform X2 n=1 Tax=Henckelia pumila TaxID=405737 RepID=UPI003C6E12E0